MICDRRVSAKVKGKDIGETSHDVWFRDATNRQKTRGRAGGGRAKDAEILFRGDKDGQDQEQGH